MSGWKEYKLGEALDFGNGKVRPKSIGTIPVYGGNGILNFCNESNYENETIIIGRVGAYCGAVYYENKPIWISDNALAAKPKEKFNTKFLYYFLKNLGLNQFAEGSSHPLVTQSLLNSIDIFITDNIEEQLSIVSILSSLDDKIDLLHRQNKTLEALAETLFRQWFVEEANSREEITLGDYVSCINGYSYKSSELNPSDVALVTLKSFNRDGGFRLDGFKEFTGKINEHQIVKEGDLVVAHTDITQEAEVIGNPVLIIEDPRYKTLVMTMDLVKVVPRDKNFSVPFLYHLMRTPEFKFHCLGCANGTTVLHLSKSAIPSFNFLKPDFEKVKLFTLEAKKLTNKFLMNHSQIHTLTQLRDTLLPKLMSGEVRVKLNHS